MTSVCQVKSRIPHDVLMTKTLSSLSSYADEDSASEKTPEAEKSPLAESEKQICDKSNADTSEFSIANILGFQGKKTANAQFDRPSDFSKWRLRDASPTDDDELDCTKITHQLLKCSVKIEKRCENSLLHGRSSFLRNAVKTEDFENNRNQEKKQTCERKETNITSLTDNGQTKGDDVSCESQKGKKVNSNDPDSCPEEQVPSAWASALTSYYESLNPTWRMWQDLIIRRSLPVAPSSRQHPGFHPYMRRFPGLANPPHPLYGNLNPFPLKIDASKSKNLFTSEGIYSEEYGKTNESTSEFQNIKQIFNFIYEPRTMWRMILHCIFSINCRVDGASDTETAD